MFGSNGMWNPPKFWTVEGAVGPVMKLGVVGIEVMTSSALSCKGYHHFVSGDPLKQLLASAGLDQELPDIFKLCKLIKGKVISNVTQLEEDGDTHHWRWLRASLEPNRKPRVFELDGLDNFEQLKPYVERYMEFDKVTEYVVQPTMVEDVEATKAHRRKQYEFAKLLRDQRSNTVSFDQKTGNS